MKFEPDAAADGELRFIGRAGDAAMAVGQLNPKGAVLEDFNHRALRRDLVGVEHGRRNLERRAWKSEVLRSTLLALRS